MSRSPFGRLTKVGGKGATLVSWSSARVYREHRALLELVGKVRQGLVNKVEKQLGPDGKGSVEFDMETALTYKATLDGGAKLANLWFRRLAKLDSELGHLSDDELDAEIARTAKLSIDQVPDDVFDKLVAERRRERLGPGQDDDAPDILDLAMESDDDDD